MPDSPSLTIGFPTIDDPRAVLVLNIFQSMHREIPHEFIIVDNSSPDSPIAQELAGHVRRNHPSVKYIRDDGPPSSSLYKDRLFREATGDVVVCFDAHVYLEPETIQNVLKYFSNNPDSRDLLMGPIQNAANRVQATNQMLYASEPYRIPANATVRHGIVCRGGQLAVWMKDERGLDPNGEPFEIQMNGTGFFAMRREAWPGFHPSLYGFGGCEPYLMESVRKAGGRVLCHPGCRWTHDFTNGGRRGYTPYAIDKVRNYLVSALALNRKDMYDAVLEHFGTIHPQQIDQAIVDAEKVMNDEWKPQQRKADTHSQAATREIPSDRPESSEGQKPGVYEKYILPWKKAGGDIGGSIPRPLFVQLCHLKPTTLVNESEHRPVKTLEFGCGLSTLAFDRQGVEHTAVEHDQKWIDRVQSLLKGKKTSIVHAPIKDGWYDWEPEYGTLYDFILIDGPPGTIGREGCLNIVGNLLAPGGVVVVDDTHREVEQNISEQLVSKLGMTAHRRQHGKRSYDLLMPAPEPLGEGPGTVLLDWLKSMPKMPRCQLCHKLARRMNEWGTTGCREHLDDIVDDMLPRARRWWQHSSAWMKADAWFKGQGSVLSKLKSAGKAAHDIDAALRDSIRAHVLAAIEATEKTQSSCCKRKKKPPVALST